MEFSNHLKKIIYFLLNQFNFYGKPKVDALHNCLPGTIFLSFNFYLSKRISLVVADFEPAWFSCTHRAVYTCDVTQITTMKTIKLDHPVGQSSHWHFHTHPVNFLTVVKSLPIWVCEFSLQTRLQPGCGFNYRRELC